jgi:hypothetical protein
MSHGIDALVPELVRATLIDACRRIGARNLLLLYEAGRAVEALQARGISVIVLKGAYLASDVYSHSAFRRMADIDLLVQAGDLRSASYTLRARTGRAHCHARGPDGHVFPSPPQVHKGRTRSRYRGALATRAIEPAVHPWSVGASSPKRVGGVDALTAALGEGDRIMAEQWLSADLFEPLVGQSFAIELKDGTVPLILRSVRRLPPPQGEDSRGRIVPIEGGARKDPFTLLFGGVSHLLPQRTYRITSSSLGDAVEIFIVPVGQDRQGFIYEAVFG